MSEHKGLNRAKFYQLALFPMNNGATNVYFVLILSYIATFGENILGLVGFGATNMIGGLITGVAGSCLLIYLAKKYIK